MSGGSMNPLELKGWAATVYIAPDPVIINDEKYKSFAKSLKSSAEGSDRIFVNFPLNNHERGFRQGLSELMQNCGCAKELCEQPLTTKLSVVIFHWQKPMRRDPNGNEMIITCEDSDLHRDITFNEGKPIGVYVKDCMALWDEDLKQNFQSDFITKVEKCEFDAVENMAKKPWRPDLSDLVILKPSVFGIGVDLNAIFRNLTSYKK